ncbi:ArsC family reductase [Marinimicrobium sp. ABcell2]|uniref:ArsC family reductase n=1 Tax=Marinimicrobium sp. ABcell2 TaxID=3069751 RepID=UPI0027AEE62E|nr:ArsC family reductase [Marinimicrobium sp. ABcell2]MDQ2075207.1 ArsC family reductase [Marinimicrobium sp. ABcell2]
MGTVTLYGIANCDTVKKARRWLSEHGIEHRFHDFRADGLDATQVRAWLAELGPALVNKRSTSWKSLDPATREQLSSGADTETARAAILAQPTLIKRPLLDTGSERHLGFSPATYATLFNR